MDVAEVTGDAVAAEVVAAAVRGRRGVPIEDLAVLAPEALLSAVRDVEVVARRLDAARVALADAVDLSGAHGVDGHRTAKAALVHLGRLSGAEAHRRVRTARALRRLPHVAAAFGAGRVPTEAVHAISRAAANPRVAPLLEVADPVFAEQAATESHSALVQWLGEWERLADADGAAQDAEASHRRRRLSLVQNGLDGSWLLRAQFGALQGAVLADALAAFVAAEDAADHAEAVERVGRDATPGEWGRTAGQRRADGLIALVRAALTAPADGRRPEPLVSIVIDQASFEGMLATAFGDDQAAGRGTGPPTDRGAAALAVGRRTCATTSGHRLHPIDAVAAALIGRVRRVVIDGDGRAIDLGRSRRVFSGAAKEAAELRAAIDARGPVRCLWSGCSASRQWLQVDHALGWAAGGRTDQCNANLLCGHHNRLKETGYRPVRGPDGTWRYLRPDGTPITPPI